jgi:DNA helicase IV
VLRLLDSKAVGRNECLTPNSRSSYKLGAHISKNTGGIMNLSSVIREIRREKANIKKDKNITEQKKYYNENKTVRDKSEEEVPRYRPQKTLDGNEISSQELGTFMNELNIFARYKRQFKARNNFTSRKNSFASSKTKLNTERSISPLGRYINPVKERRGQDEAKCLNVRFND